MHAAIKKTEATKKKAIQNSLFLLLFSAMFCSRKTHHKRSSPLVVVVSNVDAVYIVRSYSGIIILY